jgi:hypothetical protein
MRTPPSDRGLAGTDHRCMGTLRTIAETAWRESWNRAFWPSLALSLIVTMDNYTRGPSISGMLLTYLFT